VARIRSIKPSIWGDERFAGLSRDGRLLALGLISNADDAGRFIASPTAIAGAVFPHDELSPNTIRKWRDEIARSGLIRIYKVGGRDYGWFPNWKKHQVINRPGPSVLPAPPGVGGDPGPSEPPPDGSDSVSDSVNGSRPDHGGTRESLTTGRGGGKERKNPPDPPSELGGTRCTDHKRPRRGCPDCHLPPLAPVPDWCRECSPSRRVEHPDTGVDLGPCPRCHPSVVRSA
jgi:hypothetical protein